MFQRRSDRSVDFYQGWTEYENGFGNMKGEHWMGLKNISCMTGTKPVAQLRVDLADFEGRHKYAHYSYFSVGNPPKLPQWVVPQWSRRQPGYDVVYIPSTQMLALTH